MMSQEQLIESYRRRFKKRVENGNWFTKDELRRNGRKGAYAKHGLADPGPQIVTG